MSRRNRDEEPDPQIVLTLMFLSSLFLAQLASSFITSRNLIQMFESDGDRREQEFRKVVDSPQEKAPSKSGR